MAKNQSEVVNPNVSVEDQDVELKPVIMAPGAYASPDPATAAVRLGPVEEYPLDLADDYAEGVASAVLPNGGGGEEGLAGMKKDELVDMARDKGIEGFSSMNKDELVAALEAADEEGED